MEPFRIVFIGNSGVGKSCLCIQFCQRYFNQSYEPTLEDVYLTSLTYDSSTVRAQIIDVGGSDILQSLREELLVQPAAFVLVYSITDRESFTSACSAFAQLQRSRRGGAGKCIFVGNKMDQHIHRTVSVGESAKFCTERDIPFVEVSATMYGSTARLFRALLRFSYEREICNDGTDTVVERGKDAPSKQALQTKKKRRSKSSCDVL